MDKATGDVYYDLPQALKQEIQDHIDEATAQAPSETKSSIQLAANDTYESMDNFMDSEKHFTPIPDTWKAFKENEVQHIHEALNAVSYLVGKNAQNVKETLESKMDALVDATSNTIKSFHKATAKLTLQNKQIKEENLALRDSLENIQKNIELMEVLTKEQNNPAITALMEDIKENHKNAMQSFGQVYYQAQQQTPAMRPVRIDEYLTAAKDGIHQYKDTLSSYVGMAKHAAKSKKLSLLGAITRKTKQMTEKIMHFMDKTRDSIHNGMTKGQEAYQTVSNLKLAVVDGRNNDMKFLLDSKGLQKSSDLLIKGMAKDGLSKKDAMKAIDQLAEAYKKELLKASAKPKYQKMFKTNEQSLSR